ncbi:hypothetical protein, partial [Vibrio sagamiensis]|uniref:hypothetical protein n=1 Tax=Vibrio sagamiensis TaxID=512650 RepID=UPI0005871F61
GSAVVTNWDSIVVNNITASDYSDMILKVSSSDGTLLSTTDVLAGVVGNSFSLNINTATYNTHQSLRYLIRGTPVGTTQTTVP